MNHAIVIWGPGIEMARDHALDLGLLTTPRTGQGCCVFGADSDLDVLEAWKRWANREAVAVSWAHSRFGGDVPGDAFLVEHSWKEVLCSDLDERAARCETCAHHSAADWNDGMTLRWCRRLEQPTDIRDGCDEHSEIPAQNA